MVTLAEDRGSWLPGQRGEVVRGPSPLLSVHEVSGRSQRRAGSWTFRPTLRGARGLQARASGDTRSPRRPFQDQGTDLLGPLPPASGAARGL